MAKTQTSESKDSGALRVTCEELLLSGQLEAGYRLLVKEITRARKHRGNQNWVRWRLYWLARFLNAMGAGVMARNLILRHPPVSAEEFRIAGILSLTSYDYVAAESLLRRVLEETPDDRDARLAYLDAIARLGKADEAVEGTIDALRKIRNGRAELKAQDPLTIRLKIRLGKYLLLAGEPKKALQTLQKIEKEVSAFSGKLDLVHGTFNKYFAAAFAAQGNLEAARARFDLARASFPVSGRDPEMFLALLCVENAAGLLSQQEIENVACHPSASPSFRAFWALPTAYQAGRNEAALLIDLASDEYFVKGQPRLGVTFELRLLGLLRLMGSWPINRTGLKGLLWPDEPFSFFQMDKRLDSLISRLERVHRAKILRTSFHGFSLHPSQLTRFGARDSIIPTSPSAFARGAQVTSRGLESYYEVSSASVKRQLRKWKRDGHLVGHGSGGRGGRRYSWRFG